MSSKITLHLWSFEEGELHLFNLDSDPYEEVDLAVEKEEKLNRMKELAREWAADLKVAFQPNRFPPAPFSDGQETFCPATYRPRTYIVPGQYVAFEVCFEGGRGCS